MKKKNIVLFTIAITSLFTLSTTSSFATTTSSPAGFVPYGPLPADDDVTSSFTTTMRKNAAYMAYFAMDEQAQGTYPIGTGMEFASRVRSGSVWDYKQYYGSTVQYIYNGKYCTGEDLGNMHYGFAGKGAGFSDTLLKSAAGAYQIYSGTSYIGWYKSYFDDPRDQSWIDYGMSMFNNNSWPKTLTIESSNSGIDTSLFILLTEEEKREIDAKVKAVSDEIKENQKK